MKGLFLKATAIATFSLFFIRLLYLQVLDNHILNDVSKSNAIKKETIFPERGFIYDRNNILLVSNWPSYDLIVVPNEIEPFDTLEFCQLLNISPDFLNTRLNKAKKYSSHISSIILSHISKKEYSIIQEKMFKYPGFAFQKRSTRHYHFKTGAHFLGYISEANTDILKHDPYYSLGDFLGKQGIEEFYEKILRGKKGFEILQKNRFGKVIDSYRNGLFDKEPIKGTSITLAIDNMLQNYGEQLMKNKKGAIVAIEPGTGEILSLVSSPSFAPEELSGRNRYKNYLRLYNDTIYKPLYNRALLAEYPPGSTFKPINALIGLEEGVINKNTLIRCEGGFRYGNQGFMNCHCTYGKKYNIISAITMSSNSFFAHVYKRIIENGANTAEGLDKWARYLSQFGLGEYLGVDMPIGRPGKIPNSEYYNKIYKNNRWFYSNTISNSIGQGEILLTPLQMANFVASIANRGFYYKPHLIKEPLAHVHEKYFKPNYISIKPEHFNTVIEGMCNALSKKNGTAYYSRVKGIDICGKTGTSQNAILIKDKAIQLTDHSLFIGFAPRDNPKIAVAVVVENGYWGSRWAAPIGTLMIEKYLQRKVYRKNLEKYISNGDLRDEYKKPFSGKPFKINE